MTAVQHGVHLRHWGPPRPVDQTILAGDTQRLGNCVSACVASFLGVDLETVPHFVEVDRGATVDGSAGTEGWYWLMVGYMAAHGLWSVELEHIGQADTGEIVFVGGPSPRGVLHQVLYRDRELWHDPHPSRAGVLEVTDVIAWRPRLHDHSPSTAAELDECTLSCGCQGRWPEHRRRCPRCGEEGHTSVDDCPRAP